DYGRWTLDLFNLMEFDCFVIGNHEFDWGIEEILKYHDGIKENGEANFPLLAANVFYKGTDTMLENTVPYVVLDKGDKKVGVIGTIGYRLESTIITYNIEDYEFGKPQDSIKKYAPKLRNLGCDVIISVSHDSGNTANSYISSLKNEEKVDLILNAHDHVIKIDSSNGIPVLEAGSDGRAIGSVLFKFDINGKIIDKKLDNISSDPLLNVKNEEIDLMINQYKNLLDEEFGKSIISPSYYINKNELSTWIGKLMAIATSSSLGFQNSGGTREGLYAYQPIDGYKIFDILPFDNVVVTLELSGANLVSFLSSYGTDTYYAGIDVGQISSQAIYKIATNDYIYYKYSTLQKYGQNVKIHDDLVLRDLMKEELELQSQYEEYFSLNNQIRTTNVNALLSFLNVNVANGFVYYS
ncbi:5'-nucleotidase C-terminal domain-containing protein, partial [Acholeplasma sp. OttesenSCG-928-E16]|nr:5'-nucleotidase C-terminal domain-containing protein [Acholeplasma sp. OttesenSCG-928-E16]